MLEVDSRANMIKLESSKYGEEIIVKYHAVKSNRICKDCDNSL